MPQLKRAFALGLSAVGSLICTACVPSAHLGGYGAAQPTFDPIAFFEGRTEGRGSLNTILSGRNTTLVAGLGKRTAPDALVLEQSVRRGAGAPALRTWELHRVAPGRYAGTLSDASGPVAADVAGNRLHIAFPMKGGLSAQQWLYLSPNGQIAQNRMVVTKLGIPIASLDEVITRAGATR